MTPDDLAFANITEVASLIRRRELSPVELVDTILSRIERLNPVLNAFITVTADEARRAAHQAEQEIANGRYRGPLHGIPFSLKDLYLTQGIRTTGGSRILAEYVPTEGATVVEKLYAAGAILLGKTNMHEFAYGSTTINPHYGATHNPWHLDRITAGSSGGSAAATAAGLGYASLGSETGWSIRRPASFCGVVGFKPTYGLLSRWGMLPAAWSLDHAGPLTRTVKDAALVANAIAGHDPSDPASSHRTPPDCTAKLGRDLRGVRIGLPRHHYTGLVDPVVESAFDTAMGTLETLGARLIEIVLPRTRYAGISSSIVMSSEVTAVHDRWIRERPADYGEDVRARVELGYTIGAADYIRGLRLRRWISAELDTVFQHVDVVACPTAPQLATPIAEGAGGLRDPGFIVADGPFNLLRLFALIGIPAVSVPCGFSADGLPIGLSIAGRAHDDATVLHLAHAYECATKWHQRRPSI
ncbi:MAG: amidase [Chloroflexi bacterium]|nr:amidase [Chloroflexota bacterium]